MEISRDGSSACSSVSSELETTVIEVDKALAKPVRTRGLKKNPEMNSKDLGGLAFM